MEIEFGGEHKLICEWTGMVNQKDDDEEIAINDWPWVVNGWGRSKEKDEKREVWTGLKKLSEEVGSDEASEIVCEKNKNYLKLF